MTRHAVLANNLANVNTPGFKRNDVDFKKTLADALKSGDVAKLAVAQPEIKTDRTAQANGNGNSVSTQTEIGLMGENSLLYTLSAQALGLKYQYLHKAISGK